MTTERNERIRMFRQWCKNYIIYTNHYVSVNSVTVTVAGVTFCENVDVFPSENLINNITLAIQTGNVEKTKRQRYIWEGNLVDSRDSIWNDII